MRLVFDLDGTLCTSHPGKYETALPIEANIARVNDLASQGHEIVIFTARGMATFKGCKIASCLRWGRITKLQLKSWGLSYHKLILGKPSGDLYIDDKAIEASEFFK